MRNYLYLFLLILVLTGCKAQDNLPEASLPRPSDVIPAKSEVPLATPQGDFFYSLPNYSVGETVTLDGYTITVTEVTLDGSRLQLDLELANESGRPIDLSWAVQLIREESGYIAPITSPVTQNSNNNMLLANRAELGGIWSYELQAGEPGAEGLKPETPVDLDNYRLLYAPFGWSGPVFIFRLTSPAG